MALGKPLHLRLFLEGLEVPVIGAQISMNTNGPSSAAIQVIPLDSVMDLKPRTMVHLFYLDAHVDRDTGERWPYRLLFMGEVHGFAFQQTPMSRACVLQCLDFSSYWDSAKTTAIEYGPWGNALTHNASVTGSSTDMIDNLANHQVERLLSWLGQKPITPGLQTIGGLAGGIIRMLEALGGVTGHHKGINDFFTVAQLRCRILEQIIAEDNDNTARALLGNKVLDEWLKNGIQNSGTTISFRDMMLLLFKYIYYESVPISTPFFTDGKKGDNAWIPGKQTSLGDGTLGTNLVKNLNTIATQVNTHVGSTKTWGAGLSGVLQEAIKVCKSTRKSLSTVKFAVKGVASDANKASAKLQTAENTLGKLRPDTDFSTDDSAGQRGLKEGRDAINEAAAIISGSDQQVEAGGHYNTKATTQRVRTQIIRPDCWFAVPPTCNVIFPEHYTSLNFDRVWTQETTRVLVMAHLALIDRGNAVDNALLATRVLAPAVNQKLGSMVGRDDADGYRALMKHEYHVGINAREEWLPDTNSIGGKPPAEGQIKGENLNWSQKIALFHFFKYRFAPRQASLGGRFNPNVVCGFPAVVIRRPIVPPPWAMDPKLTEQELLDTLTNSPGVYDIPYQLVGMIAGVNHSIDQSGGVTNISMHSVRRHSSSDDEFLGIVSESGKQTVDKTVPVSFRFKDLKETKNTKLLKLLADITPQGKEVPKAKVVGSKTEQKTVSTNTTSASADGKTQDQQAQTITRTTESEVADKPTPKFTTWSPLPGINDEYVLVPHPAGNVKKGDPGHLPDSTIAGIEVKADETQQDSTEMWTAPGEMTAKRYYSEAVIYLKLKIPVPTSLPVEEMIRPNWFSPAYKNTNVGKDIYGKFFGCGSIVDGLVASRSAQGSPPPPDLPPVDATDPATIVVEAVQTDAAYAQNLSVEKAINAIAFVYGQVKADPNLSADDYIDNLTFRPIATKTDILGDENLRYDGNGDPITVGNGWEGEAEQLRVGFHSGSVNPDTVKLKNLKGLMKDPSTGLPRINDVGSPSSISPALDVRWEKQQQVTAYLTQLVKTHGLPG